MNDGAPRASGAAPANFAPSSGRTVPATDALLVSEGAVASVTLNLPDVGNRVDGQVLDALAEALEAIERRAEARVLVIRASGPDFCLGRRPSSGAAAPRTAWAMKSELERVVRVNRALGAMSIPTIAAVQGAARGFGCGLALLCDLTIAVRSAVFSFPEILDGLPPALVATYLARYVPRKHGLEMLLLGRSIDASEALALGMVNRVVEPDDLDAEVDRMAAEVADRPPIAMRTIKRFFASVYDADRAELSEYAINVIATALSSNEGS